MQRQPTNSYPHRYRQVAIQLLIVGLLAIALWPRALTNGKYLVLNLSLANLTEFSATPNLLTLARSQHSISNRVSDALIETKNDNIEAAIKHLDLNHSDDVVALALIWEVASELDNSALNLTVIQELASSLTSDEGARAFYGLGRKYTLTHQDDAATRAFEVSLQLNAEDRDVWYELGRIHVKAGNTLAAVDAWENGIAKTSGNIEASNLHFEIAGQLLTLEEPSSVSSAVYHLKEAIRLREFSRFDWQYAASHYRLGQASLLLDDEASALNWYTKANELRPRHYWTLVGLARTHLRLQQFDLAKSVAIEAVSLEEQEVSAYVLAGDAYRELSEPQTAGDLYTKALELDHGNARALRGLRLINE